MKPITPRLVTRLTVFASVAALPVLGTLSGVLAQNRPTAAARMQAAINARFRPPQPGSIIFNDRSPRPSNRNLEGATYVGIERCAGCHSRLTSTRPDHTVIDEWETPETNPHARDGAALGGGRTNVYTRTVADGHPVFDKDGNPVAKRCDVCHSTGAPDYNQPQNSTSGGFDATRDWFLLSPGTPPTQTPANWDAHKHNIKFARVQCENCHGPGSKHVLSGGSAQWINRVPDARQTCFRCHAHAPNEKGNILDAPATDEQTALYSNSLARGHSGATLITGTGGYEYEGEDYSAGRNHPHTRIRAACVTCHTPKHPRSPILDHSNILPKIEACRNCHGDARSVSSVEEWDYVHARQAVINALLIQLGGATVTGAPDRSANGGLLGNAADKNSVEYKRARWNHSFVVNDASSGAHNFDYAIQLLTTSIAHAPAQSMGVRRAR